MIPAIQREGAEGALVSEFLPVVQLVPFKMLLAHGAVITVRTLEEHFLWFLRRWRWHGRGGVGMHPPRVILHIVTIRFEIAVTAIDVLCASAISEVKPLFRVILFFYITLIVFHLNYLKN